MRIVPTPQVCSWLLCGLLIPMTGCSNPSSQTTLDSLVVTATPPSVGVGGTSALKAMVHLSDGTTQDVTAGTQWTLSDTTLASISKGALIAKAPGTLTVQGAYVEATPAGASSAAATPQSLSASTQITITASGASNVPTITWNAPAPISYGTALSNSQLAATANVPGSFVYTPAAGTVLKAGTQTLSTTFTPTDSKTYSTATASVQLSVQQATPTITWAAPTPITAGTALSATQLDATANVPGSFMYNPAAGAILAAGTQQLTAVFSPSDATDYASATAHTSLTVTSSGNPPGNPPSGPTSGPVGPAPIGCGGPTVNLNSGMSQSTLQSTISSAPSCALIVFGAGTYNVSSTLNIPCASKLTLTGPAASPATAILNATFTGSAIFGMGGCSGITIDYLGFKNTEGMYISVPSSGSSGIDIEHNQFFGLPGNPNNATAESGIYFDGATTGGTLSNVTINWNNFGSPTDCNGVMTSQTDQGGYCAGITFTTSLDTVMVSNNTFVHVEEGFHVNCTHNCEPPASNTWKNFTAQNNDFSGIHRIAMEMQPQPSANIKIQYNSLHDFTNGYFSTMGISSACCDTGATSPGTIDSNNVIIANSPAPNAPPEYIPFGIEFWGNGALAQGNLIQGYWANGISWGYAPNAVISNNNICGPNMAAKNWYISNEEHQATPTISSNTTSATCSTVASTPPSDLASSGRHLERNDRDTER